MPRKRQPSTQAVTRRARAFRAALALAGITASEFAEHIGVHRTHLYLVLRGDRPSPRVNALVEAFIKKRSLSLL